jgi:hypothetical protein
MQNRTTTKPRLSVSTWSLHRALGSTYPDAPANRPGRAEPTYGAGSLSLLEVPARLAAMGIHTLEICHFHLPRDPAYWDDLRDALDAAGVELWMLLIDAGDITHAEHASRDVDWVGEWIDAAGVLGAQRARVIAGQSLPTPETLQRSQTNLAALARRAQAAGVRLMTENWHRLLARPEHVHGLLGGLGGTVGLLLDFGNWGGTQKYDDLGAIFPLAESCHAKCSFTDLQPDANDYQRCLELGRAAGFTGPYTLIYDGPDADEWRGLALERDLVLPYVM